MELTAYILEHTTRQPAVHHLVHWHHHALQVFALGAVAVQPFAQVHTANVPTLDLAEQ
jgi:hypothetical protein